MTTISHFQGSPSNLINRLPNELLAAIREVFPPSDLVYQVRFYQVSERTAAFYDSDDEFWLRLCRLNGLGSLCHEVPGYMDWKRVALECERHTRTCEHPGCGAARLSENGELPVDQLILFVYLRLVCQCRKCRKYL